MFVFFFKQKTAYEMRISDWSSDVCSSDLLAVGAHGIGLGIDLDLRHIVIVHHVLLGHRAAALHRDQRTLQAEFRGDAGIQPGLADEGQRSEEHTSELQSLMRISYAVFCLKKKKENSTKNITCE